MVGQLSSNDLANLPLCVLLEAVSAATHTSLHELFRENPCPYENSGMVPALLLNYAARG